MKKNLNKTLTKPRSPFNARPFEDKEERKKRIQNLKPNRKFHDIHTINWFRQRFTPKLIEKSVFSLLPDNGRPMVPFNETENEKKHRLQKEWLDNYCQPRDPFKYLNINPKYLFNEQTYEKLLKFKEMFLQFNEDGSRRIKIKELEEMFNNNKIPITTNELVSLFFKKKDIKKEKINSLFLDFYQFIEFALKKDQDFREFMRKLKNKRSISQGREIRKEENDFLPMNFNLVIDYLTDKGKERHSKEIIEEAFKEMEKIINRNSKLNNNIKNEDAKVKQQETYEKHPMKINFNQLILEFSNLFHINFKDNRPLSESKSNSKLRGTMNKSSQSTNCSSKTIKFNSVRKILSANNSDFKNYNIKNKAGEVNYVFSNMIDTQLEKENIAKMSQNNLNKFHSIEVAVKETKKSIDDYKKKKIDEPISLKSTMYGTHSFFPKLRKTNSSKVDNVRSSLINFGPRCMTRFGKFTNQRQNSEIPLDFVPNELLID